MLSARCDDDNGAVAKLCWHERGVWRRMSRPPRLPPAWTRGPPLARVRRHPCTSRLWPALLLFTLSACGDEGGGDAPPPEESAATRTLAYVVTECREDARKVVAHQKLQIRQGEREITVRELTLNRLPALGLCPLFATSGAGAASAVALPFQRLGVSPDGSAVVFEVTDDHSIFAAIGARLLPRGEEEGIFVAAADGSGLRRLGPASREAAFRFVTDPSTPYGVSAYTFTAFSFSPDGRTITFTDLGPDRTGEEAIQIVTLDVDTGERQQITHLPPLVPLVPSIPSVAAPWFLDAETIGFWEESVPEVFYTVKADGSAEPAPAPAAPVPILGSRLVPDFSITAPATGLLYLLLPGTPVNDIPGYYPTFGEIFVEHGENLLQLTNFRRSDTGSGLLDLDQQRVVFKASADPFGANPDENCQFFSIDTLGGDLRQLTHFGEGIHSLGGCGLSYPQGCFVGATLQDPGPGLDTVVFYSTCDPLGTNPNGGQVFAMRFDGTGLRQLTHTRGAATEADGTVTVELPGPFAYPQAFQ